MPPRLPNQPHIFTNWQGIQVEILPRQPGETSYAYRNRRSISLTGESLYQRRIRQGRARGLTTQEARGQRANEGQRRYERQMAATGQTPWQFWRDNQVKWLVLNGFTPDNTGWSWNRLIRIAPRLRWMNERAAPGGTITPLMIHDAVEFEASGELPSDWTWERINERYIDTLEFVEYNNNAPGNFHWFQDRIPEMEIAWWFYH